ncbi:MAG TPA: tyrosine-type recombinase/integrase, partial [Chitinophagales bacterium]|nr:tyrosine-type recombinase/integrase [Chitinophagales bacterium]
MKATIQQPVRRYNNEVGRSITPFLDAYVSRDGKNLQAVKVRVTVDREHYVHPMGFSVTKKQWHKRLKEVTSAHPHHGKLNADIDAIVKEFKDILELKKPETRDMFLYYHKSEATKMPTMAEAAKAYGAAQNAPQSEECYISLANHLDAANFGHLPVDKFHYAESKKFFKYLMETPIRKRRDGKLMKVNTAIRILGFLRSVMYEQQRLGHIPPDKNPFIHWKFPNKEKVVKDPLTAREVALLCLGEFPFDSWRLAVDVWLWMVFAGGMRISDALRVKRDDALQSDFLYEMTKTKTKRVLELDDELRAIVERNLDHGGVYLFNYLPDNFEKLNLAWWDSLNEAERQEWRAAELAKLRADVREMMPDEAHIGRAFQRKNKELQDYMVDIASRLVANNIRKAAAYVGIEKNIHPHLARNTFGVLADANGVSRSDIQHIYGHASGKQTEDYLQTPKEVIDRTNLAVVS